jgi:hypothetical protein
MEVSEQKNDAKKIPHSLLIIKNKNWNKIYNIRKWSKIYLNIYLEKTLKIIFYVTS